MHKIKYILITIFLSIVIVSGLLAYSSRNLKKIELFKERRFDSLKLLSEIQLNDKYSQIKIFNNTIYLVNSTDKEKNNIYKYISKDKSFKLEFNLDKNSIVGGYFINDSNKLFFKDNDSNKLKITTNNKTIYEKEFEIIANRLLMINENSLIITTWNTDYKPLFYKYHIKSNLLEETKVNPVIYNKLKYPGLELDGKLIHNNKFIYLIPYGQNLVLVFDKEINFVKSFELNFKKIDFNIIKSSNQTLIDPNNIYPNFSAVADDNYIYILTNKTGEIDDRKDYYIDLYNVKNDKYEKSFKLKNTESNPPKEIALDKENIYILNEKTITIYGKNKL